MEIYSVPIVVLQWITVPALLWLGYSNWLMQNRLLKLQSRLVKVETLLELILENRFPRFAWEKKSHELNS